MFITSLFYRIVIVILQLNIQIINFSFFLVSLVFFRAGAWDLEILTFWGKKGGENERLGRNRFHQYERYLDYMNKE